MENRYRALSTNEAVQIFENLRSILISSEKLFYPSSGKDLNDIFYINKYRNQHLFDIFPNVFIHIDYLAGHDASTEIQKIIAKKGLKISSQRTIMITDNRVVDIYNFELPFTKSSWLIFFRGFYNEEVLDLFIKNRIKIPFIYAMVDGISSGMGVVYEYKISTILYPLLKDIIGIKYLITEQDSQHINSIFSSADWNEDVLRWLKNLSFLRNDDSLKKLFYLSFPQLSEKLTNLILPVKEIQLNKEKLECYHPVILNNIHLKYFD